MVRMSPPNSVHASPVTMPTWSVSSVAPVVVFAHAGVLGETRFVDQHLGQSIARHVAHGLAGEIAEFPLQRPHTRFPRVITDQVTNGLVRNRPLGALQAMILGELGQQMATGDLDLLILGVAGIRMISMRSIKG